MKVNDLFVGLFFACLGAYACWVASTLPTPRHVSYGPGLFPAIVGGGLVLVGAVIAVKALPTLHREPWVQRPLWLRDARMAARFWSIPAAVPVYLLLADDLGFLLTATLIIFAMLVVRGVALGRALGVSVGTSLLLTVLFGSLLKVPLPWGPLTRVSGYLLW